LKGAGNCNLPIGTSHLQILEILTDEIVGAQNFNSVLNVLKMENVQP